MATKPNTTQAPSFSLEALKQLVDIPEARAMLASILRETRQEADKADTTAEMDRLTVAAFKRRGFANVTPRVSVLTYARWIERGFKVKEGERAIKVKNLRLFCTDQVQPITKAEQAEYLAKRAAKGTASKLPEVSPIPQAAKPAPRKGKAQPQATA